MAIKKLKHITVICRELYEQKGASAVYDYANQYMIKHPDGNVRNKECGYCDALTPHWCMTNTIFTVQDECRVVGK